MYRPARRAFAGFCEAVAFFEDEAAVPAGGGDHFEVFTGFVQGPLKMLEMVANIFFRYLDYLGKLFRGIRPFLEQRCDIMPYRLIPLCRLRALPLSPVPPIILPHPHPPTQNAECPLFQRQRHMRDAVGFAGFLEPELPGNRQHLFVL